jgi:carbamoyltransferase
MIILGINDTHDASASLIIDGKLKMAIQEERFTRSKNISSLPINSIKYILDKYKLNKDNIDLVCVATNELHNLNLWNIPGDFTTDDWRRLQEDFYVPTIYKKKKIKIRDVFPKYKPSIKLGYSLKEIPFSASTGSTAQRNKILDMRINKISEVTKVSKSKINFFDHHLCHAMYGYYLKRNKAKKTIIVTADGGGDRCYNTISVMNNDKFKMVYKGRDNLIGVIYEAITLILGMNPTRHAYKVMGLAPYASESQKKTAREIFLNSLKVKGIKFIKNKNFTDYYHYFKNSLRYLRFDGIAGGLQDFVEIRLLEWFKNISQKFKCKDFVFSGGVANNIKANKILSETKFINSLFVPPGPGDESLCIGACFAGLYSKLGGKVMKNYIKPIDNAYWGDDIDEKNFQEFKSDKYVKKTFKMYDDYNLKGTAKALSKGNIVFFCHGRMEFGQRALGHRSILSDPSKLSQVKKINETIKMRDFWMPFTPSILSEDFKKYIINKKNMSSDYMTMSFDSTLIAKKHFKAAIHPYDQTIRPQKVSKNTCSTYYKLIKEFKKITGIGGLLNTSLNMHDKPIVRQPTDILSEIMRSNFNKVNYMYINGYLFEKKTKI